MVILKGHVHITSALAPNRKYDFSVFVLML